MFSEQKALDKIAGAKIVRAEYFENLIDNYDQERGAEEVTLFLEDGRKVIIGTSEWLWVEVL